MMDSLQQQRKILKFKKYVELELNFKVISEKIE